MPELPGGGRRRSPWRVTPHSPALCWLTDPFGWLHSSFNDPTDVPFGFLARAARAYGPQRSSKAAARAAAWVASAAVVAGA